MKATRIITLLLLLASFSFYGQGPKKEKIKALKIAFFTKELSLTSTEAEKFWPIFNAFESKQFEIRFQKMRGIKNKIESGIENMSEKDAQALILQMENAEEELHQNRKKLITSLKTVLPGVKILKLKKAEDDFNRKLLKQYREKGPERP